MTTAKDIIHTGATCVGEHETLFVAAQHMFDLGVGALPICGDDDRLHGMITDRDIVIKCLAAGNDPNATTAGELAQGSTYHVEADARIEEMLNVMEEHQPCQPFGQTARTTEGDVRDQSVAVCAPRYLSSTARSSR